MYKQLTRYKTHTIGLNKVEAPRNPLFPKVYKHVIINIPMLCRQCNKKSGLKHFCCEECHKKKKEYYKIYYHKNKEKIREHIRKYQQSEKGIKKIKEYRKEYLQRPEVKAKQREYDKVRYYRGDQNKLYRKLNRQIRRCIIRYIRDGKLNLGIITIDTYKILYGLDLYEIINHLKPFPKDIENYELDHIIPIIKFDLTNKNQIKKAYEKTNLQLISPIKNKIKGAN